MIDKKPGTLFGIVAKYFIAIGLVLVSIYLIFCLVDPVFEKIGESIGIMSQALNVGRGDDFHSLVVLVILCLFLVGLAKLIIRRK